MVVVKGRTEREKKGGGGGGGGNDFSFGVHDGEV